MYKTVAVLAHRPTVIIVNIKTAEYWSAVMDGRQLRVLNTMYSKSIWMVINDGVDQNLLIVCIRVTAASPNP